MSKMIGAEDDQMEEEWVCYAVTKGGKSTRCEYRSILTELVTLGIQSATKSQYHGVLVISLRNNEPALCQEGLET